MALLRLQDSRCRFRSRRDIDQPSGAFHRRLPPRGAAVRNSSNRQGVSSLLSACHWLSFRKPKFHKSEILRALLQLGVLRLGLLQDGDVGVGVFPKREEIFVGGKPADAGGVGIRAL